MLLGIRQAREYLGCGATLLNQLMATGQLDFVQHTSGGKRWIEKSVLDDFIRAGRKGGWKSEEKQRPQPIATPRNRFRRKTRGAGTIRQRQRRKSDGSISTYYEGQISLGMDSSGRRVRRTVTGFSESEVQAQLDAIDDRPKTSLEAERMTVGGYLTEWLEEVKVNNALNTWRAREAIVRPHIKPHVGGIRLVDFNPDHIRRLLQRLRANGVGTRTLQLVLGTLHTALNAALQLELIHRNPAARVARPKHVKRKVPILTSDQAKTFLAHARETKYYALFILAITMGERQGELFALRWADVNLKAGYVSINSTLTVDVSKKLVRTEPKTPCSIRRVPLTSIAINALRELKPGPPNQFVFRSPEGAPIRKSNFIRRVFHPLLEKAELPRTTFHSLRHVCASLLLEAGVNEKVIQGMLGHASSRLTMDVYTHIAPTALNSAAQAMDQLLRTGSKIGSFGSKVVSLAEKRKSRKAKQDKALKVSGRSRVRTYDPSRVKQKQHVLGSRHNA